MLKYIYTAVATQATTGYFSCLPADNPNLDKSLELFYSRPLDSFLHSHVLNLLRNLPGASLEAMARRIAGREFSTGQSRAALLSSLLLELAGVDTAIAAVLAEMLDSLRARAIEALPLLSAPGWVVASPEDLDEHRHLAEIALANIQAHASMSLDAPREAAAPVNHGPAARQFLTGEAARLAAREWREQKQDPRDTYAKALEALERADLLAGPEMRHEASLSPIALLRSWHVRIRVDLPGQSHAVSGRATAYGRGLSLAGARASCIMEIVERASAYCDVSAGGEFGCGYLPLSDQSLRKTCAARLLERGEEFILPAGGWQPAEYRELELFWLRAVDPAGCPVWVPFQSVALFSNLPEARIADSNGSSGLGAGNTMAEARLSALLEAIERDAHATMPFSGKSCFAPYCRDATVRGLLEDYHARHIFPQFQEITTEIGVPVYRCFVQAPDGEIVQATGAGLNGMKAALSALTETPWPYVWARPAPYGSPTAMPPPGQPLLYLEDLPDYDLGLAPANLALLENLLAARGCRIAYAGLTRKDLAFPVVRAIVAGLEPNGDFDALNPPGQRFFAHWRQQTARI